MKASNDNGFLPSSFVPVNWRTHCPRWPQTLIDEPLTPVFDYVVPTDCEVLLRELDGSDGLFKCLLVLGNGRLFGVTTWAAGPMAESTIPTLLDSWAKNFRGCAGADRSLLRFRPESARMMIA